MGAKARKKQEKQLKTVKKQLEQERKTPRGRKAYALCLAASGVISLIMVGSSIFNGGGSMLVSMCLMLGVMSLFLAYKIYDDEAKRMRKIEELERERNGLLNRDDV